MIDFVYYSTTRTQNAVMQQLYTNDAVVLRAINKKYCGFTDCENDMNTLKIGTIGIVCCVYLGGGIYLGI